VPINTSTTMGNRWPAMSSSLRWTADTKFCYIPRWHLYLGREWNVICLRHPSVLAMSDFWILAADPCKKNVSRVSLQCCMWIENLWLWSFLSIYLTPPGKINNHLKVYSCFCPQIFPCWGKQSGLMRSSLSLLNLGQIDWVSRNLVWILEVTPTLNILTSTNRLYQYVACTNFWSVIVISTF
jgi:hypothetical protein